MMRLPVNQLTALDATPNGIATVSTGMSGIMTPPPPPAAPYTTWRPPTMPSRPLFQPPAPAPAPAPRAPTPTFQPMPAPTGVGGSFSDPIPSDPITPHQFAAPTAPAVTDPIPATITTTTDPTTGTTTSTASPALTMTTSTSTASPTSGPTGSTGGVNTGDPIGSLIDAMQAMYAGAGVGGAAPPPLVGGPTPTAPTSNKGVLAILVVIVIGLAVWYFQTHKRGNS